MPSFVPAASRVFQVLETFAKEKRPLSNSQLARKLDLADSSCSDLLHTMLEQGYLLRTPRTREFYPTSRLLEIAQAIARNDPLTSFAEEALELLTTESGETALCGVLEGQQIKIFASRSGTHALRYVVPPGTLFDIHSTALGKAILSEMEAPARQALLSKLELTRVTSSTIQDMDRLKHEIDQCAKEKWCLAKDEGNKGVSAIGIAGEVGGKIVSLSLVGPTHRFEDNMDQLVGLILSVRNKYFGEA